MVTVEMNVTFITSDCFHRTITYFKEYSLFGCDLALKHLSSGEKVCNFASYFCLWFMVLDVR